MNPLLNRLVFGGSFDPPHAGHLAIINFVLDQKITKHISVVPVAVSPFKTSTPPISGEYRMKMLELLLEGVSLNEKVDIESIEIQNKPPSYTINTLQGLSKKYDQKSIGLLIGSDSLIGFTKWKSAKRIIQNHPLVIFKRENDSVHLENMLVSISKELESNFIVPPQILDNEIVNCSSTQIKRSLLDGKPHKHLSPFILKYMKQFHLYKQ